MATDGVNGCGSTPFVLEAPDARTPDECKARKPRVDKAANVDAQTKLEDACAQLNLDPEVIAEVAENAQDLIAAQEGGDPAEVCKEIMELMGSIAKLFCTDKEDNAADAGPNPSEEGGCGDGTVTDEEPTGEVVPTEEEPVAELPKNYAKGCDSKPIEDEPIDDILAGPIEEMPVYGKPVTVEDAGKGPEYEFEPEPDGTTGLTPTDSDGLVNEEGVDKVEVDMDELLAAVEDGNTTGTTSEIGDLLGSIAELWGVPVSELMPEVGDEKNTRGAEDSDVASGKRGANIEEEEEQA